jgi:hypothetical protein
VADAYLSAFSSAALWNCFTFRFCAFRRQAILRFSNSKVRDTMSTEKSEIPRVAFLGFCERANQVTAGHPLQWFQNIMGLTFSPASFVYPWNLRGLSVLAAVFEPAGGEHFELSFRGKAGQKSFGMTIDTSVAQQVVKATAKPGEYEVEVVPSGAKFPGWMLSVNEIGTDLLVLEPGEYDVLLLSAGHECNIGTVYFAHFAPGPMSGPERDALLSDPLANKLVKAEFSCSRCHSSFRVYTALERAQKLEDEGWQWSQSITEERFRCQCGELDFSLAHIKLGFHGLLHRSLSVAGKRRVGMVRLYETTALEETSRRFLRLLNSRPAEEEVQKFLEANQIFFHTFTPLKLLHKPPILTKYRADFAVLNNRKELLLIEIERPALRLLKKDGGVTADLQHAIDQVRNWIRELADRREASLHSMGIKLEEVARVRAIVVAGRTIKDPEKLRQFRSLSFDDIGLMTYDDMLRDVSEIIKQVSNI